MTTRYAFQQLEPQCARGAFDPSMMTDPDYTAEIKYDGDRRIAQFCPNGMTGDALVRFTGRKKSVTDGRYVEKTENVPHLARAALGLAGVRDWAKHEPRIKRNAAALVGTVLDGEMIIALEACAPLLRAQIEADSGGRSKYVTSVMGSLPDVAREKQIQGGWLRYIAFDCLYYKGRDVRGLPYEDRRALLIDAVREWQNPFAVVAEECPDPRRKQEWLAELWERGEEGIILKKRDAPYGKKFQRCWVKRKQVLHAEAFIVGFEEARAESRKVNGDVSATKYAERGLIGAVRLAQYRDGKAWECASVSGMTDALREELSRNRKKHLMRVVRLKANAREPSGRFRHPQWAGWCDEKTAQDCTYYEEET